ncbi:hypothetical protein BX070DRAFT_224000 [Coemansia spiralis]|nr:hypothetical protein BX070DRAFT_224000 [Coemansia spiralis]
MTALFFMLVPTVTMSLVSAHGPESDFTGRVVIDTGHKVLLYQFVCITIAIFACLNLRKLGVAATFAYNCFFKRLGKLDSQQKRLNAFYGGQASVYDTTRSKLLRGRKTMLRLCGAELQRMNGDLVWVDVGGGTGWNIEKMDEYFGIHNFKRVYLVDLCEPLCRVAEQRFKARGWTNIEVVCQDAKSFNLPGLDSLEGTVDLITMSYSLSMIEEFYPVVDRLCKILKPQSGILGVADFYISDTNTRSSSAGILSYQCSWFMRIFWQHWFEFDHVFLHPCRRNYLEHRFDTHKVFNGRNHFVLPYLVQIPFYVWLGKPASSVNLISGEQNAHTYNSINHSLVRAEGGTNSGKGWQRLPYQPSKPEHAQFSTYIYGFTWEDPRCDLQVLDLKAGDNLLLITSAGDNALAYAAHQDQIILNCVDMNPCQNHLLELKLASLRALDYNQFWQMFGKGWIEDFDSILDTKLSPWLSSSAYQYWKTNCLKGMLRLMGVYKAAQSLTRSKSLDEQMDTWRRNISGWIHGTLATWFLDNPVIMWQLLGVPVSQWTMLRSEGSMSQYVRDTLEPVVAETSFTEDNYFYYLLLALEYSPTCCPDYLTKSGFDQLKHISASSNDRCTFKLHTSTILNVLRGMQEGELTKAVIMDHMDWFSLDDAQEEVGALARVLAKGVPWYIEVFTRNGFSVEPISVRQPNTMKPLDRVNMYASFYKATKF